MSRRRFRYVIPLVLALSLAGTSLALAGSGGKKGNGKHGQSNTFVASLSGHQEVPAIHTNGMGRLTLTINDDNMLSFELTYANLSSPAGAAHVHFAQPNVNGGVSFFFCGGGGKPACPAGNSSTPVTVTGTVAPADVLAITAQGMPAGDLGAIVSEIKAGFTYANVHTTNFPGGEIRGQLVGNRGNHFGWGRGHGKGHDKDD
jgi:CHRD domain-containing protein